MHSCPALPRPLLRAMHLSPAPPPGMPPAAGDKYGCWQRVATKQKRPLASVILAKGLAEVRTPPSTLSPVQHFQRAMMRDHRTWRTMPKSSWPARCGTGPGASPIGVCVCVCVCVCGPRPAPPPACHARRLHASHVPRDRPPRRGYLLYGPPGNGKSSFITGVHRRQWLVLDRAQHSIFIGGPRAQHWRGR
jgi:hypothetical protein